MRRFLLQMAGESGTGKSTMARAIGRATGAVVVDKDYIKAPLLEEGLDDKLAGGLAYAVFFSIAGSILGQGFDVILDSPAYYSSVRERGVRLAIEAGATYQIIECQCGKAENEARLRDRQRLVSQPASRQRAVLERVAKSGITPLLEPHLVIDTSQPLDICLRLALEYLQRDAG
jgi:predicted kinase